MTCTYATWQTITMNTVVAYWFITKHALPTGLANTFKTPVTISINTTWQADALLTELTCPSHFTFTGEWL